MINPLERRRFIKNSACSLFGITVFGYAARAGGHTGFTTTDNSQFYRYPAMNDAMVSEIVGASHSNLPKVKELVGRRPELAKACWDWGFGDFETALGAASHVGRRDIAEYLMSQGARPDIFTFAMMGMLRSVQEIIETVPGIQTNTGPHSITLLQHAKNRLNAKDITAPDSANVSKVVSYLESIGNADIKPKSIELAEGDKQKYLGEYRFGAGDGEILVADLTSAKLLKLGRKGTFGSRLVRIDEHSFYPVGGPSVRVIFKVEGDKATAVSIHEPEPLVTALRI